MKINQMEKMSRGRFLHHAGVLATLCLAPREMFAKESPVIGMKREAANARIVVQALRGNINVLQGSGGNITLYHGTDGVLMVDAGIAGSQKNILSAIRTITEAPIKYLINTHWHFDHTDGSAWVHNAGASIIAHENTLKNLSKTITIPEWDYTFPPAPAAALPTTVFQNEMKLEFNNSEIRLKYYQRAHTDSDISVYFPEADVLSVGDTWWNGYYPFIDHNSGGRLDGMIEASNRNLEIATNKTIIIPGHGAVGNRSQLLEFRDMLAAVRENVSKLKNTGRSLAETVAAKPTATFDGKWGTFGIDTAGFIKLVYTDV